MLSIRLSRIGKKKSPFYRIIVLDNKKDPWGKFIENLGTYNPMVKPKVSEVNAERVKYWLSVGAQPSVTVHNILVDNKVIDKAKVRATSPKKKAKTEEEIKAEAKAIADAKAAKLAKEEAAKAAETPAESTSAEAPVDGELKAEEKPAE